MRERNEEKVHVEEERKLIVQGYWKKVNGVYFALETAFAGKRVICVEPTATIREDAGSCSSSCSSVSSGAGGEGDPRERKLGSRTKLLALS